ncbi:hypothetical protein ACWDR0_02905 [Streptomyces sp. NPDC003691]
MAELNERSWAEAIGMYARRATIAKVAGREHDDWALDASTLIHSATSDARGWRTVDLYEGELERLEDPFYPFTVFPDGPAAHPAWQSCLHEISRSSAERFLVALSTPWIDVGAEPHFNVLRGALEEKARTILSRFPEGSRFYANTGSASATLDYYQRVSTWHSLSSRDFDFGLFLVSTKEIGMVWSFR